METRTTSNQLVVTRVRATRRQEPHSTKTESDTICSSYNSIRSEASPADNGSRHIGKVTPESNRTV